MLFPLIDKSFRKRLTLRNEFEGGKKGLLIIKDFTGMALACGVLVCSTLLWSAVCNETA